MIDMPEENIIALLRIAVPNAPNPQGKRMHAITFAQVKKKSNPKTS